ncbi:MAG: PP2C family protein-serine/threonine phosphatase [Butyricicoccaceae bacterium]
MRLEYSAKIDQGRVRPYNEDAAVMLPQYGFFAVSDGMGGLLYGRETAQFVVEWLRQVIAHDAAELEHVPAERRMEAARKGLLIRIRQLNEYIYKRGNAHGRAVYGATLAAAWIIEGQVLFANVGDSRGYQTTEAGLVQRSEDHNVAAMLVEIGQLTAEEAKDHPTSCQLTQFIGCQPEELFPSMHVFDAPIGSRVLLCSDGLYGMLEEVQLQELMQGEPEQCCEALIAAANEAGGRDNISAVIAVCCEGEPEEAEPVVLYAKDEEPTEDEVPAENEQPVEENEPEEETEEEAETSEAEKPDDAQPEEDTPASPANGKTPAEEAPEPPADEEPQE